jgi:hypothetical protein
MPEKAAGDTAELQAFDQKELTSMVIVPAENLALSLPASTGTTIGYSQPFALQGHDRASAILTVWKIFGGTLLTDRTIYYQAQTSLDGLRWVDQGPAGTAQAAGSSQDVESVYGTFIRFKFTLEVTDASGTAGALFSVVVNLDKA